MSRALAIAGVAGVALAAPPAEARPNTPGSMALFRYQPGDVVEHRDAGEHFRIFYTASGPNAASLDHVLDVAELYENVRATYESLGFRVPLSDAALDGDNGGDGRFDVYLLDFGGSADGAFVREGCDAAARCAGYIVQENDFAGYAYPSRDIGDRILVSHEFFHAVQAAYDAGESSVLLEGTAVWATERFDPTLEDFEGFVDGVLDRPDHTLFLPLPGPVDPWSYGAALFFQFLDEHLGDDVVRDLLEASTGTRTWAAALPDVLAGHGTTFGDAFFTFARWNLFTADRADPAQSYAGGAAYPPVAVERTALPAALSEVRLFAASARYFAFAPSGRTAIDVALVNGDGVQLALATRRGNRLTLAADRFTVDTDGVDEVLLVAVNGAAGGESVRPSICAGDAAEVEACLDGFGAPGRDAGGCTIARRSGSSAPWGAVAIVFLALSIQRRSRCRTRPAASSRLSLADPSPT
jgi:hypothetical protein